MAGIVLYAGLLEPAVEEFDFRKLPASHWKGIALMNILRILDIPAAVGLLFPRKVTLRGISRDAFSWTERTAELFKKSNGASPLRILENL